jgi:hypothetical protein
MTRPEQDFIAAIADALKARSRAFLTVNLVGGSEKQRFATGTLIGAEQVMREYFRPAGMQRGVIMGSDEHALGHQAAPPRVAMNRS